MTTRDYTRSLEPLLIDFKDHIRMTSSDMDASLKIKLMAAVRSAEHYIGRVIALSGFTLTDVFAKTVTLNGPVIEVTSVTVDGETITPSDWTLSGDVLTFGDSIDGGSLVVDYTAGALQLEPDIEAAILLHAAALFNNPVDSVETLPKASTRLLDPYRSWGV